MNRSGKTFSLIICFSAYIIALIVCILIYPLIKTMHPLLIVFILDIVATIIIFLFSMVFNNSSIYDPYWSLAPIAIFLFWILTSSDEANVIRQVIIFVLVATWGVRLTLNWIRRWKGLNDEDWRYVSFRNSFLKTYWLVSFGGIHLFPTIIVFLGCMAVYPAVTAQNIPINIIDIIAIIITLSAIVIETISDEQLRYFIVNKKHKGEFIKQGLWKYSRHPNYLGEVLFWIGLFIFSLHPEAFHWWTIPGPLAMILLFSTISVPMMDKRMVKRKEGYKEYMKETAGLVPWVK